MIRRIAAMLLATLGLAACATEPAPAYPELTYTHIPAITLGVAKIEIVDQTTPAPGKTRVDALMPLSPAAAMTTWAQQRLRANGVSGVAKFIIQESAVTETRLKKTTGITGAFTKDQSHRYDAAVRAVLKLEGVPRVSQAFAEAIVNRSQTIREDASINDREQLWFELTEQVMRDFDPTMSASIRKHLGDFIR